MKLTHWMSRFALALAATVSPVLAQEEVPPAAGEGLAPAPMSAGQAFHEPMNCHADCGPTVGEDFWTWGCRGEGITGGFDVLFIKPYFNERINQGVPAAGQGGANFAAGVLPNNAPYFNYQPAPRGWVGYVNKSGLGVRGRIFDYYSGATQTLTFDALGGLVGAGSTLTESSILALRTFDLELTQEVDFRYWNFTTFGGARYGQAYGQVNTTAVVVPGAILAGGTFAGNTTNTFYGVGLTGGLQAERALTESGAFSFFINGRGSMLYGGNQSTVVALPAGGAAGATATRSGNNAFLNIWELSVGPQYNYVTAGGARLSFRMGLETQLWQNFAPLNTIDGAGNTSTVGNFALSGFSIGGQLTR